MKREGAIRAIKSNIVGKCSPKKDNIILVMSGGSGKRYGADCPKQYCNMLGRLVIDFVIDACRQSKEVDEIVVVASTDYVNFVAERYGVKVVAGGSTRPESVANGIRYIHDNYNCGKLIITNAVCPLATSEQYDKYFKALDSYDYVLTTWKLAPALHRFDGVRVDRDDYFNVMEPDAYKFEKLYDSFDFKNKKKYIFHNMPLDSKGYFCFDYPYTMKLTHPHDLKMLEVLYQNYIMEPNKSKTFQTVNGYLSASGNVGIADWILKIQNLMADEIIHKYRITSYVLNTQTEANLVYEACSSIYGDIIVKFTPSTFFFHKEYTYYQLSNSQIMADLIDYDLEYNMLIIKKLKPGIQVKLDVNDDVLRNFFDLVDKSLIPVEKLQGDTQVPFVMDEFEEYVEYASCYSFEHEFRKCMEEEARKIYSEYFGEAPLYYLHRDLHRRNLLRDGNEIRAIDPRGAIGPREFEYVIQFVIEMREDQNEIISKFDEIYNYFSKYVSGESFMAALFVFFVYKLNDYTFQKKDDFKLASWMVEVIKEIFFPMHNSDIYSNVMPDLKRGYLSGD